MKISCIIFLVIFALFGTLPVSAGPLIEKLQTQLDQENIPEDEKIVLRRLFRNLDFVEIAHIQARPTSFNIDDNWDLETWRTPSFFTAYQALAAEHSDDTERPFNGLLSRNQVNEIGDFLKGEKRKYQVYVLPRSAEISYRIADLLGNDEQFNFPKFLEISERVLKQMRNAGEIGNVYGIYTNSVTGRVLAKLVELPAWRNRQLMRGFHGTTCKSPRFTREERRLMHEGELNEAEVYELRAIRRAGSILELATILRRDVGGTIGNLTGALIPGEPRTLCYSEALTHGMLVDRLIRAGAVHHFEYVGISQRHDFELFETNATLIKNKRTRKGFVVDSYYVDGGIPATVLPEMEWLRGSNRNISANCFDQPTKCSGSLF